MRNLTILPVAFAAVLTAFAANAQSVSDKPAEPAVKATTKTTAKGSPDKSAKDDCPYLFGCANDAAKAEKVDMIKTSSIAGAATKGLKSAGKPIAQAGKASGAYATIISHYASSYGVPVSLAQAVIKVESNYRPNARGSAREIGLMQIKPATARMMGYSGSTKGLFNPETNIKYGMKYLAKAHELGGGTTCGTILKYNAGHAAKRMNKISAAYCTKVKRHMSGA